MGLFGRGKTQRSEEKRPFLDPLSLHRGRRLAAAVEEKRRLDRWAQSLPETGRIMGWFSCLPADEQESMIRACLPAVARSWIKASMRLRAWFGYLLGMLLVAPAVPIFVLYVMHGLDDLWMSETFGYWPVVCIAAALLSWKLASFADVADRAGWPVCDPVGVKMTENMYQCWRLGLPPQERDRLDAEMFGDLAPYTAQQSEEPEVPEELPLPNGVSRKSVNV